IIRTLTLIGETDQASELSRLVTYRMLAADTRRAIAVVQLRGDALTEATRVAKSIFDGSTRGALVRDNLREFWSGWPFVHQYCIYVQTETLIDIARLQAGDAPLAEILTTLQKITQPELRIWGLAEIAKALVDAHRFDNAFAVAQQIDDAQLHPLMLSVLIQNRIAAGQYSNMEQFIDAVINSEAGFRNEQARLAAIEVLGEELSQKGRRLEADQIQKQVLNPAKAAQASRSASGIETLSAVSRGLIIGRPFLSRLLSSGSGGYWKIFATAGLLAVSAYGMHRVVEGQRRARVLGRAEWQLSDAIGTRSVLEAGKLRAGLLVELIYGIFAGTSVDAVLSRAPDDWMRAQLLIALTQLLSANPQKLQDITAAADRMHDHQAGAAVFIVVADALVRAGQIDHAQAVIEKIADTEKRLIVLSQFAQLLCQRDRRQQAADL